MKQEQINRVEELLIDMIENAPAMNFRAEGDPKVVSTEGMKASAELALALIALHESATTRPPNIRVANMVGGKPYSVERIPIRGINVELPEKSREPSEKPRKEIPVSIVMHVDTRELDAALAKAERLEKILSGVNVRDGAAESETM